MARLLAAVLAAVLAAPAEAGKFISSPCYRAASPKPELVTSTPPRFAVEDLPASLDWRNVSGISMVTPNRNQHIPHYCGACWSFAATSSVADRIKIARNAQWPEVVLAPQVILNCDKADDGCHGGDPLTAFEYMRTDGVPSETCQNYEATGHDVGATCTAQDICRTCNPDSGCSAVSNFDLFKVTQYAALSGEAAMMSELATRGPITCTVAVPQAFEEYTGGVFVDTTGDKDLDHSISVVGWGVTSDGTKYWIGRNSWGNYWGESGWFRIVRGVDNLGIESNCAWAVPDVADFEARASRFHADLVLPTRRSPTVAAEQQKRKTCRRDMEARRKLRRTRRETPRPTPEQLAALPAAWDWRNVTGINMVTWDKNQHIPQYCGSCWAQATTSAFSDRMSVSKKAQWPQINVAPQVLINCGGGGSCEGGDPEGAFDYMQSSGLPDQTCQAYQAADLDCNSLSVCETCSPSSSSFSPGTCTQVKNPKLYHASDYGGVSGADSMKAEIFARGPIACGMSVTDGFEAYTGGVYSEYNPFPMINHEIEVAGWGVTSDGTEYWIGRNSWGTYWGEHGWFRMKMHSDNLAIESDCDWVVPQA